MRKRKNCMPNGITRTTPFTPSLEKLPSTRRICVLPSPHTTWILQHKGTPTCCIFICNRCSLYPGFFCCHSCSEWDIQTQLPCRKVDLWPLKRHCTANHTSFLFPSDRLDGAAFDVASPKRHHRHENKVRTSLSRDVDDNVDSNLESTSPDCSLHSCAEVESSQTSHTVEPYDITGFYRTELEWKDREIMQLEKKLESSKKLVSFYKQKFELQTTSVPQWTENIKLEEAVKIAIDDAILFTEGKAWKQFGKITWLLMLYFLMIS